MRGVRSTTASRAATSAERRSRYARWADTKRSETTRTMVLALIGAPMFLGLLPLLVAGIGPRFDRRLGLRPLRLGMGTRAVGGVLMLSGFGLGFWSVAAQVTRGGGTPLPVMPTQRLLTEPPFCYCRNPMTLGTILAYLGLALARGTLAGCVMVAGLAAALVTYLKGFEEQELAERFGDAYLAYKQDTPFIVPRFRAA